YVAIFGGDHIYKMDVRQMISAHIHEDAEATIACIPVPKQEAGSFGVLEIDEKSRVIAFHEKGQNPPTMPGNPEMCLASMGNYVFTADILERELAEDATLEDSQHDFGHDVLPRMVRLGKKVVAYDFAKNQVPGEDDRGTGYWRDIGTLSAYWAAQMDLIE